MYVCMNECAQNVCPCIYVYIYYDALVFMMSAFFLMPVYICIYAYMYVYISAREYTYIFICSYISTIIIYIYVYRYICLILETPGVEK